jgi:spoIIIJ-associated protein
MSDVCERSEEFLEDLFDDMGLDLEPDAEWTDEGCYIYLTGKDVELAVAENAELLDALETLLFQIYGRELEREHRFVCDADGFRQTRKSELHAMARFAADQVRKSGRPFTFGVLTSTERRIIHMSLREADDLLTESVGAGRERRLQISPK